MIKVILKNEVMSEEWNPAILRPLYKKRFSLNPKNYREMSLLDTCYIILSTHFLEIITSYVESSIGRYQCGFIMRKSTIGHMFTLKQIIKKHNEFDTSLYDSVKKPELKKPK